MNLRPIRTQGRLTYLKARLAKMTTRLCTCSLWWRVEDLYDLIILTLANYDTHFLKYNIDDDQNMQHFSAHTLWNKAEQKQHAIRKCARGHSTYCWAASTCTLDGRNSTRSFGGHASCDFTAPTYALSFVSEVCNMTRILLLVENSFKMGGLKTLPIAKQGYHTATPTTTCYSPAAAAASPHLAPTFLLQYGSLPRLHLRAPLATWETGKGK